MFPLNKPSEWPPAVKHTQVQTRSESTGLIQHNNLYAACQAASKDSTIWKISYTTNLLVGGTCRCRLTRDNNPFFFTF